MEDEDPILKRERLLRCGRPASADFRNPFARNPHGDLVSPEEASSGVLYSCPTPECLGAKLAFVPKGEKHAYFRHVGAAHSGCGGEGSLHILARERISDMAMRKTLGFMVPLKCERCGYDADSAFPRMLFQFFADYAPHEERLCSVPGTTRRGDVLLYVKDRLVLIVEILKSNEIDARKEADYARVAIPWVEIRADHVVWFNRSGPFKTVNCDLFSLAPQTPSCEACNRRDAKEKADEERRTWIAEQQAMRDRLAREAEAREAARKAAVESERLAREKRNAEDAARYARERAEWDTKWDERKRRESEERDERELRDLFLSDILRDLTTLVNVKTQANLNALYHAIGRTRTRVKGGPGIKADTPDGVGKLWQVFADRVGVDIGGRVHFFSPSAVQVLPESDTLEMQR